jgi:hypothetical protein
MSLDVAVDVFSCRGEARSAAVLAAAVETALAPQRFPDFSYRRPALAVRTAILARALKNWETASMRRLAPEGVAMSRGDALAFALHHL